MALNALGLTEKSGLQCPMSSARMVDMAQEERISWFIPGKVCVLPMAAKMNRTKGMRERSKLAGLSGEGRSSATTLLISSALEWMNHPEKWRSKRRRESFLDSPIIAKTRRFSLENFQ